MSRGNRRTARNATAALAVGAVGALLLAGCSSASSQGAAENFPQRPVELVNPWAAGGSHDAHARAISSEISDLLGQPMTVSIKSGGAGSVGATAVAKQSKPDGYTLLLGDQTSVMARSMAEQLPYTWEDFRPVAQINDSPIVITVPGNSPYDTIEEFVAAAKAKPGTLKYGSVTGLGPDQIPVELLIKEAGIDIRHIPFEGGGPSYRAVLAEDVDMAPLFPAAVTKDVKEKRLKALAVTSAERIPGLAEVPTLKESGFDVEWEMFRTVFAPKGTPDAVVESLADDFGDLSESKGFHKIVEGLGEEVEFLRGEELEKRVTSDAASLEALVENLK
ncbi:MAG: Bug family tripartite tricarboxylate transporter substrate binding protein [Nocardioidaceae bacterium]